MTDICERCGCPTPVLELLGTRIEMRFCEPCGDVEAAAEDERDRAQSLERALTAAGATPRLLEQTLATHPDEAARAAAEEWLAGYRAGDRRNLWLSGPVGLGKTGLAWGIVRLIAEGDVDRFWETPEEFRGIDPRPSSLLLRWADLLDDLKAAFDSDRRAAGGFVEPSRLLERAKRVPVLALDDLGRERPTPYAVEKLANLIEERYQRVAPMIVTSNYSPRELTARLGHENAVDGERLVSRLRQNSAGYRFDGPSFRRA